MKGSEMTKLMVFVGSVEGRDAATQLQEKAWMDLIGHLEFGAAMDAAREHYRTESRRLWPADLLGAVRSGGEQAVLDFEVEGARLSEGMWANASRLPRDFVRALGQIAADGDPGAVQGFVAQLELDFDLRRRLKAVE